MFYNTDSETFEEECSGKTRCWREIGQRPIRSGSARRVHDALEDPSGGKAEEALMMENLDGGAEDGLCSRDRLDDCQAGSAVF